MGSGPADHKLYSEAPRGAFALRAFVCAALLSLGAWTPAYADAVASSDLASGDEALAFELPGFNFAEDLKAVETPTAPALPEDEFSRFVLSRASDVTFSIGDSSLSGFLTLDHIEQDTMIAGLKPAAGVIGDATLNWRLSESFSLSTTVGRRLAETQELAILQPMFEETLGGGVTYYITPNFAMSAEGVLASPGLDLQSMDGLPGDAEASVIATWQFLPFFAGSVNYTYELRDETLMPGQIGPESTVSFTLIGKF